MPNCPCGSDVDFSQCCEPYLTGRERPPTAETLMRSRYSAFVVGNVDYIEQTLDAAARKSFDRAHTTSWAKDSEWLGLQIVRTDAGQPSDARGEVEFVARYRYQGELQNHHECAEFRKHDGRWFFVDGRLVVKPYRAPEKPGRNDPCNCGSGKKYKKCHGMA